MKPRYSLRGRLPLPLWALYRVLRTVLVASAFVGFWTGATLLAWSVLPLVALVARDRRLACQRLVARTFRFFHGYMRLLRLLDARLIGPRPELHGPVVFVANHATLVDVTAILAEVPRVCCVAKHSYSSSRFVGRLLSLCGFIDAGQTLSERSTAISDAVRKLEEGFHVLVFPEGSRSPDGSLRPFQRGAFEIACRARVPVVPLVLRCNPRALGREQRFWAQPDVCADLTIEVHESVEPANFEYRSRPMRKAVERRYHQRLELDGPSSPPDDGDEGGSGATSYSPR